MSPRHHLSFCACKTAWLSPELVVSLGYSPHLCFFFMQNSDFWTRITSLYGSETSPVVLCIQNSVPIIRNTTLYGSQPSSVVFCMHNSDFLSWITSFCGSQTWPVVVCIWNSVISTRITSLYGSQPSSMGFASKTATYETELQVSMGPRHQLSFCVCNTAWLAPE